MTQRDYSKALSKQACAIYLLESQTSFFPFCFFYFCCDYLISVSSSILAIQHQATQHPRASAWNPFVCSSVCRDWTFHLHSYTQAGKEISRVCYKIAITDGGLREVTEAIIPESWQLCSKPCLTSGSQIWTPAHHPSLPSQIWPLTRQEAASSDRRYALWLIQWVYSPTLAYSQILTAFNGQGLPTITFDWRVKQPITLRFVPHQV